MTSPATVMGLTRKQAQALCAIGALTDRKGYAPTLAEICVEVGMSRASAGVMCWRVQRLRERGYVVGGQRRMGVILTDDGRWYCAKFAPPAKRKGRRLLIDQFTQPEAG